MTENEKRLLKVDNKRKIKEANNINTENEELEMMAVVLDFTKESITPENIAKYNKAKNDAVLKYIKKNNMILSNVLEFKIRQIWDIYNAELSVLEKKFHSLEKHNFENKADLEKFQNHAIDISYLIDELGYTFRTLANKKAKQEHYNDIISEYIYDNLDINKLFLKHSFYKCNNIKDYTISAKESFELLSYIEEFINNIINDMTKEKCTTGANILMVVSVEIEGMYCLHF